MSLKKRWQRLPARTQVLLHLAAITALLFLTYVFMGCPAVTVRSAFRRAEKAAMVGPSDILAQLRPADYPYDALVLADDGDAVTVFALDRRDGNRTELVYREKTGDVTVLAAPGDTLFQYESRAVLPLIVFDNYANACRAELELTLRSGTFEKTYALEAVRENMGYFQFSLTAVAESSLGDEGRALRLLQEICSNSMAGNLDVAFPAAVRLYDDSGLLLFEDTLYLRSAAAQAQQSE